MGKIKVNELAKKVNMTEDAVIKKLKTMGVEVKDKKQVDKEKIKQEGIDTIVVSSKKVTMVVGNDKSNKIYNYINNAP